MGKYSRVEPKRKKHGKYRFPIFMIIYTMILVSVITVGLTALWKFVYAYEKSLPNGVIEVYETNVMKNEYESEIRKYAESLKTPFQSGDDILELLEYDTEALNLKKDTAESTDNPVYIIRLGKKTIGRVFCRRENLPFPDFGFKACQIDHSEWKLSDDIEGSIYQISAPQEAIVCVNGIVLDEGNCSVELKKVPASLLSQGLDELSENQYSFTYYGVPEVTVKDSAELEFTCSEMSAHSFAVDATIRPETCTELAEYAENFVRDYLAYTSNAGGAYTVLQYLIKDTSMYNRIAGSLDGMRWVLGVTAQISDLKVDHFTPYGEAVMCEAHYNLTDLDENTVAANMRLLLVQQENAWKVYNIEMF